MTELLWESKYKDGKKVAPVRMALPFQTIETVNESAADRSRNLDLFASGREGDWRNRLIGGDKKYALPSLLPEFAGKVNLIYIDPPFDTGANFSFTATIPDHPDTDEDETTSFVKQPSIIEQKAYRDTWGRGLDSYLQWFYETAVLLREGWDVQNVTVVVGLRPYSAKANILPEQTIGRGLRLMFRSSGGIGYVERVDIIGNKAFLEFVDDLEKLEDLTLETFELGKDKLHIPSIAPVEEKKEFDIALPQLTPSLVRKKSLAEEIAAIDIMQFDCSPLPFKEGDTAATDFKFEGYDILTLQKELERQYVLPDPQTAQEVIGYYARIIAKEVKLPSQFAALAPKVREFFEHKAFGQTVNLQETAIVKAMNSNMAHFVCKERFKKALLRQTIAEQEPRLDTPARWLSGLKPIPWSRQVYEARKCVFNLVPCGNAFEKAFAKFLDRAEDTRAFSKLHESFGFAIEYTDPAMNLRNYYPDFVAVGNDGTHWLMETKGQQTEDVSHKDHAAELWCENATNLTGTKWQYRKVMQKAFENLHPESLEELNVLH